MQNTKQEEAIEQQMSGVGDDLGSPAAVLPCPDIWPHGRFRCGGMDFLRQGIICLRPALSYALI